MQMTLKVTDVLRAAIMLEDRGAKFYADAAAVSGKEQKELLLQLSEMEQGHSLTFQKILDQVEKAAGSDKLPVDDESRDYLEALTSDRIINSECRINKGDDYGQILDKAMLIEKNSVFFYTAVKSSLLEKMAIEHVDHLIAEEVTHFKMLSGAQARWNKRNHKN